MPKKIQRRLSGDDVVCLNAVSTGINPFHVGLHVGANFYSSFDAPFDAGIPGKLNTRRHPDRPDDRVALPFTTIRFQSLDVFSALNGCRSFQNGNLDSIFLKDLFHGIRGFLIQRQGQDPRKSFHDFRIIASCLQSDRHFDPNSTGADDNRFSPPVPDQGVRIGKALYDKATALAISALYGPAPDGKDEAVEAQIFPLLKPYSARSRFHLLNLLAEEELYPQAIIIPEGVHVGVLPADSARDIIRQNARRIEALRFR